MIKFLLLLVFVVCLTNGTNAQEYKKGQKFDDGMIFLYNEPVEIYGNLWTGKPLHENKVYISGQGKTAIFDGILQLNCESSSGYSWITASTGYDSINTKESELNRIVPIQAISGAFEEFCNKQ